MEKSGSSTQIPYSLKKHQRLVKACEDFAVVLLSSQLSEMFEQLGPTLLDFSDKAETNDKQRQFFDAIAVTNKNREGVEYHFREEIVLGFSAFSSGKPLHYSESLQNLQYDGELSIIDNQALEEHLAAERIISKAQNRWYQELFALGKRMGLVRGGIELPTDQIPGAPPHIMYAFQTAAKAFNFDMTLLLILFTLFDKFVMQQLDSLYEGYNSKLVEAGIFPNLRLSIAKPPDQLTGQQSATDADNFDPLTHPIPEDGNNLDLNPYAANQDLSSSNRSSSQSVVIGEEIFQSICSLMSNRRLSDPSFQNHPEINPAVTGVTMTGQEKIVETLSEIQPSDSSHYIADTLLEDKEIEPDNIEIDQDLIQEIKETLVVERDKLYTELDKNTIPTADLDTIELVGMLFEHVLNDQDLPNIVKALISHLHTPYLKIAIIDHQFLIDGEHTARRFLNQLVDAGKQWVEENDLRRGLYYPMRDLINQLLRDFRDNIEVIDRLREKLEEQIADLEQKAKIVEERTKEAAKGREKLESSRAKAHRIVSERIGDRNIHPVVNRFLNSAWLDKMILMMLRNPEVEKSAEWQKVIAVIDSIIEICDQREDASSLAKMKEKIPKLRAEIEEQLTSLGDYHEPDSLALFKLLESFLMGSPLPDPLEKEQLKPISSRFGDNPVEIKKGGITPLSSKEKKIAERLEKIEFGTWFELLDNNQSQRRLKLSWFSPVTKKFMFVDRSGVQAVVITANDLTRQISNRTARVVNMSHTPFVDAAMRAIRKMLSKAFGISQKPTEILNDA